MFRRLLTQYWPIIVITIVIFVFFAKLFFPPSIFVTPDYGRSDLIHFNIPIKTIMAESLKNRELPLWEPKIGQGFPVFAEGQIGFFYFPNLILFAIFPFWLAFNLGYIVTFSLAALGTYLFTRSLKLNKFASILAAFTFTFSTIFVLRLHHYNFIQTASLMPWVLWLISSFFGTNKLIYFAFIPIVLSQQIFTGFPQLTFYSLLICGFFFLFKLFSQINTTKLKIKIILIFSLFVFWGFLIASIQLLSTWQISSNSGGLARFSPQKILTDFPLNPINLLTVLNPYLLGNPKYGSYPTWQPGRWGVFWENNAYFGIIQLILISSLLISLFFTKTNKYLKNSIFLWASLGLLGILLALGVNGPLHPIFSIPPFSFFRVPARFLFFTSLSASILAAYSLQKVTSFQNKIFHKIVPTIILLLVIVDIFKNWETYPLLVPKEEFYKTPEVLRYIGQGRILSLEQQEGWNKVFRNQGWANQEKFFLFQKNFLDRNYNVIYGKSHFLAYSAIWPIRSQIIESLAKSDIKEKSGTLTLGPVSKKILDLTNVSYITSAKPIHDSKWQYQTTISQNQNSIYAYKNSHPLPHVFTVTKFRVASTLQDYVDILKSEDFDYVNTVIIEKEINFQNNAPTGKNDVSISLYKNTQVILKTNQETNSLVVLSDSFYPGWKAKIDGQDTEILAANINSRAVVSPKGRHTIEFTFQPDYLKESLYVSMASFLLVIGIIFKIRKTTTRL